ncbi:MAG: SIS domain-containing protein [Lachnospiraceae bacterium]|nr:SIS domain-containing protein [Candidatus Darwinimomas equi]
MKYLADLLKRYPDLEPVGKDIEAAYKILEAAYTNGRKLLAGGNGGSAGDSEHIVGELMKTFEKKRPIPADVTARMEEIDTERGALLGKELQGALTAISITGHTALTTAVGNDVRPEFGFAQQVYGYGREGDVLMAISTSGNAENLINAAIVAKAKGMKVILLSGKTGGKLKELADVSIIVPENTTYIIQERHLPIYHVLCMELEDHFF